MVARLAWSLGCLAVGLSTFAAAKDQTALAGLFRTVEDRLSWADMQAEFRIGPDGNVSGMLLDLRGYREPPVSKA